MTRFIVWLGGVALLTMTFLEFASVIGRHIGYPQRGAIELIQVAILVAGILAIVASTLAGNQARVRLLVDKLSPSQQDMVIRLTALVSALFFACVLAGSVWIAIDLWNSYELSEIIEVPWRWLRAFANLGLAVVILELLRQALGGTR